MDKPTVRHELGRFGMVQYWAISKPGLTHKALKLYVVLCTYANGSTLECYPSQKRLAGDVGCSTRTIIRLTSLLEMLDLIEVTRRRGDDGKNRPNIYKILVVPDPTM